MVGEERWGLSLCFICVPVVLLHTVVFIYVCVWGQRKGKGHMQGVYLFYMSRFYNNNKKVRRRMRIYKYVSASVG